MSAVPTTSPPRTLGRLLASSLQGSSRAALLAVALGLLALQLWQLQWEARQLQANQRQLNLEFNSQLADLLGLGMELKARAGLSLLSQAVPAPPSGDRGTALPGGLQAIFPGLQSLAWLDRAGAVLADSQHQSDDRPWLAELVRRTPQAAYHYAYSAANQDRIYLLLRQAKDRPDSGYWVLRLSPDTLRGWLREHYQSGHPWLLEQRTTGQVIARQQSLTPAQAASVLPVTAEELSQSILVSPLKGSDWQLRALFDEAGVREQLLASLRGKFLLFILCSLLAVLALYRLLRGTSGALQETRRRYQDIFEGTGTALCVLDLSGLPSFFQQRQLHDLADLQRWLDTHPLEHRDLLQRIRLTETNQVALHLLGVDSPEQGWKHLIDSGPLQPTGFRMQLLGTLLQGSGQLEMERQITTVHGEERHLWLVLRLPERQEDLNAVTLSISDITSRKHIELSLIERERFWSEVVRAVPDTLYVHDMQHRRVLFSNHHLGLQLGYDAAELKAMGEHFWESILHPDDGDYYWRIRGLQQVVGDGVLLESVLRWRHKQGGWRRFSIREQALARDSDGRVSRLIGVAKDITEQIEGSDSLRDSEQRYRLLAESIRDVIFSTDYNLQLNYVSPSVEPVLGYAPDWVLVNGFHSLATNPKQLAGLFALLEQVRGALGAPQRLLELRENLPPQLFVFDCLRADGRKIPVELRLVPMWDEHGRFEGLLGVGRDISQQRRADKDLRMAATVFEHSTAAILVTDPAGYIVQINKAFSRVSGYSSEQVLDQLPTMLTADRQQASHLQYILGQLNQRGSWEGEVWLKRRNEENFPAWVGITAVQDDEGDLVSYVCFFSDISERKASEQRIHRLAYYDALTNLPNRTLFQDRLHTALQHAERHQEWVVLMFLDLDRFKPINDSLGHAAGDRMLKEVAVRLSACVDGDDTVARMGGDEFTLLLQSCASREGALNRAIHVAEQILASLVRPFILEGREFFVTASIGIALSPQDGNELSQLMKNADTAMYHAKEHGKNNFQFYQAEMNASALERLELESDLRHALEQGEFVLHYQPQFSGDGRRLTGVEALLRWQHPRRGLVPPDDFIPVLEELGLVVEVGDWVLGEACRQLKTWHQEKIRVPKISVNLSARQFADGDLDQRIASILASSGIPPACLELELTESILMQDVASAMRTLADLKRLGLCIAIDDFGTGYSSLNYLKQFPIDVLKIDRSFVDGVPEGEQDTQIARAIIAMAHSLNLAVIAEGVETQAQLDFLREHECDEVQGYLLGRPMHAAQFSAQFSGAALFMLS
ncbi:sensor domain-containing protein [Pseudomonas zhanjiangensis]|uniref:EAL domain-containing protein n=1 Tax=Pseudomonas zhanjiangensis TaxID=3239015 RepID=A0ABV3YQQ1_9PSED